VKAAPSRTVTGAASREAWPDSPAAPLAPAPPSSSRRPSSEPGTGGLGEFRHPKPASARDSATARGLANQGRQATELSMPARRRQHIARWGIGCSGPRRADGTVDIFRAIAHTPTKETT
jgi:hypothetical protein